MRKLSEKAVPNTFFFSFHEFRRFRLNTDIYSSFLINIHIYYQSWKTQNRSVAFFFRIYHHCDAILQSVKALIDTVEKIFICAHSDPPYHKTFLQKSWSQFIYGIREKSFKRFKKNNCERVSFSHKVAHLQSATILTNDFYTGVLEGVFLKYSTAISLQFSINNISS